MAIQHSLILHLQVCGNKYAPGTPLGCPNGNKTIWPRWNNARYECYVKNEDVDEEHKFCCYCAHKPSECPQCEQTSVGGKPEQIKND